MCTIAGLLLLVNNGAVPRVVPGTAHLNAIPNDYDEFQWNLDFISDPKLETVKFEQKFYLTNSISTRKLNRKSGNRKEKEAL